MYIHWVQQDPPGLLVVVVVVNEQVSSRNCAEPGMSRTSGIRMRSELHEAPQNQARACCAAPLGPHTVPGRIA
eukprot:7840412-Alexandrium_andersonii.AAC.1